MSEAIPVTVYVAQGLMEANIVKGMLESEGIPVALQYDSSSIVFGISIDSLGAVNILVPPEMAEKALSVIKAAEAEGAEGAEEAEEAGEAEDQANGAVP